MYERFFGFSTKPFALTPDPSFLFGSRQHSMALTLLEYGLESQASFALLTGEIGSGKTTLVRRLIQNVGEQVQVGLISNSHAGFTSIHRWALSALGTAAPAGDELAAYEALVDAFVRNYAAGRRTLLIVDEAQNLSVPVLEELRLLSNVNMDRDVVLQIVLVGQPELRAKLGAPELRQLAQRITVDYHLSPLERRETAAYIRHRLQAAGGGSEVFEPEAIVYIHGRTGGVPRLINQLCDIALVYAFAEGRQHVSPEIVRQVLVDRAGGQALPLFGAVDTARAPHAAKVELAGK
jgi:general secretion pathway protein A